MSRIVKFRGLDKKTNEFVYGDLINTPEKTKRIIWFELKGELPLDVDYKSFNKLVKSNSVGQFTGLKDINGKEIYEGDILNIHIFTQELGSNLGVTEGEKEFKAEICYQSLGLWLEGNKEEESDYIVMFNGIHEESFEVIGNIHENPNLLEYK